MNKFSFFIFCFTLLIFISNVNSQVANTVGDSQDLGGDCFSITPNLLNQTGAVWYTDQIDLTEYFSYTVELNLGTNDGGADGVVLVLQQSGLNAIGGAGQDLGFNGITPSLGVEFDTWDNPELGDLGADHMAINLNGNVTHSSALNIDGPIQILAGSGNAENGQDITVRLVWNPVDQEVKIFTNCVLRLSANVDLINDVFAGNPLVYWGFTGSTGGASNSQTVCFVEEDYLNEDQYLNHCNGDFLELSIEAENPTNITWEPNLYIDNINSATPTVSPTEDISYSVTYTNCGEVFTDSVHITVTTLDLEAINSQTVCPGESAEFSAVYNPLLDVSWSSGLEDLDSETFGMEGNHWAEVSDGTCTRKSEFELVNFELPEILVPESVNYCYADSSLVEITADMSDVELWNGIPTNEFYVSAEGDYGITATDQVTGCVNTASVEAVELPLPEFYLENVYEICPYETLEIDVSQGYNSVWDNGALTYETSYNDAGTHSVSSELNGCTDVFEFELVVNSLPVSNLIGNFEYCEDDGLTLTSNYSNHIITWHDFIVSESYTFSDPGVYSIQIQDEFTGCLTAETLNITELLNPIIELEDDYMLCSGSEVEVVPFLANHDAISWSNGSTESLYVFKEEGEFSVTVSNTCNSVTEFSVIELTTCDCSPYVPLAFTPDNDGINEEFIPRISCTPFEYQLIIMNRWGDVVFSSLDVDERWNGSDKNGEYYVEPGIYTYKLSYKSVQFDGIHVESRTGMVSVIR